jgi:hypothetical protein
MVSGMTIDFHFHRDTTVTVNNGGLSEAQLAYDAAVKIGTEKALQSIIDSYPGTVHAKLAAAGIAAMPKREPAATPAPGSASQPVTKQPAGTTAVVSLAPEIVEKEMKLSQAQIREVQLALQKLGYKTGTETAAFGSLTRDAIARYQTAVGIQSSGYASPPLFASLGIPYGTAADRPTSDARKYTVASLGPDADSRLVKAVGALSGKDLRFGTFQQHLYIAVLAWAITWPDAKAVAEAAGGHLVTISSKAENDFIFDLFFLDERFVKLEPDGASLSGPWIGMFQPRGAREPAGGWQWVTGEPVKFKNWQPWGPDNYREGENYARFWGTINKGANLKRPIWWDDARELDEFRSFIIEIE